MSTQWPSNVKRQPLSHTVNSFVVIVMALQILQPLQNPWVCCMYLQYCSNSTTIMLIHTYIQIDIHGFSGLNNVKFLLLLNNMLFCRQVSRESHLEVERMFCVYRERFMNQCQLCHVKLDESFLLSTNMQVLVVRGDFLRIYFI